MRIVCVRSLCRDLICIIAIVVVFCCCCSTVTGNASAAALPAAAAAAADALLLLFCFSHSIIVAVFFINAISGNICAAPRLTLFQVTERERQRERERMTHTHIHAQQSRTSRPRNCSLTHFRTMRIPHTLHCALPLPPSLPLSLSRSHLLFLQVDAVATISFSLSCVANQLGMSDRK